LFGSGHRVTPPAGRCWPRSVLPGAAPMTRSPTLVQSRTDPRPAGNQCGLPARHRRCQSVTWAVCGPTWLIYIRRC